jgi:hypothetical protein
VARGARYMLTSRKKYAGVETYYSFCFFQSPKLGAACTEAAHCSKDINAEELLDGEHSAGISKLYREKNCDSCEICKKSSPHSNNLSGHASVSSRETIFRCEMCVTSFTHKRSAKRRIIGCEWPLSCDVCKKRFTFRSNIYNHSY